MNLPVPVRSMRFVDADYVLVYVSLVELVNLQAGHLVFTRRLLYLHLCQPVPESGGIQEVPSP